MNKTNILKKNNVIFAGIFINIIAIIASMLFFEPTPKSDDYEQIESIRLYKKLAGSGNRLK